MDARTKLSIDIAHKLGYATLICTTTRKAMFTTYDVMIRPENVEERIETYRKAGWDGFTVYLPGSYEPQTY